jgi:hypothetical protein
MIEFINVQKTKTKKPSPDVGELASKTKDGIVRPRRTGK